MARKGFSVSVIDRGLDKLLGRVRGMPEVGDLQVGVINAADPETALIARVHENGLGVAPQRSFLRATVQRNKRRYAALAKKAYRLAVEGKMTFAQALASLGIEAKSDVQAAIMKGIAPPLKKKTVRRKQRKGLPRPRTALYATGKLFNAIAYRILAKGRG